MFSRARQAEIIRCNQKDEYYTSFLRSSLAEISQSLFGPQSWLHWRKELDLSADLLYFGLTTFAGYQTIGEEYVNILQVDSSLRRLPSRSRRAIMILLQVVTPYALDWLLARLHARLESDSSGCLSEQTREEMISHIPAVRHLIAVLHRCHLAVFYVRGVFYHIAKRIAGARYIQIRRNVGSTSASNYRLLGWLSALQLSLTIVQHGWRLISNVNNNRSSIPSQLLSPWFNSTTSKSATVDKIDEVSAAVTSASTRCALCLEARKHSTATPCGHIYCWDCIAEWCSTKAECPLCREASPVSRLIYLQNYDN